MTKVKQLSRMFAGFALAIMFVVCGMFAFAGCDTKNDKDKTDNQAVETETTAGKIMEFVNAETTDNSLLVKSTDKNVGLSLRYGSDTYKFFIDENGTEYGVLHVVRDNESDIYAYLVGDYVYKAGGEGGTYYRIPTTATSNADLVTIKNEIARIKKDCNGLTVDNQTQKNIIQEAIATWYEMDPNPTYKCLINGSERTYTLSMSTDAEKTLKIVYNGNSIQSILLGDWTVGKISSKADLVLPNFDAADVEDIEDVTTNA